MMATGEDRYQSEATATFFVFSDVWALATRSTTGKAATAAAAPINVRRFTKRKRTFVHFFGKDKGLPPSLAPPLGVPSTG
jgi:hypothetical protein